MTPSQKLHKNVGDLGKLIVAKGFKKLSEVQYIAQSGHTDPSNLRGKRFNTRRWPISLTSANRLHRKDLA